jgi:hypothetical protein
MRVSVGGCEGKDVYVYKLCIGIRKERPIHGSAYFIEQRETESSGKECACVVLFFLLRAFQ